MESLAGLTDKQLQEFSSFSRILKFIGHAELTSFNFVAEFEGTVQCGRR
ncbi:MAG: hypothetical protein O7C72_09305 [Deltaproteobacteria bacterium]|nr:hypothetical protein [Deltaproteobacteria bacterium]MCZ6622076.1 hypothetical protein [Deltaproteobacteria bacterium]